MTTLEIVLVTYLVLNWIAFAVIALIPKRYSKTLMFLTFVLNPIVYSLLMINFLKKGE